MRKSILGQKFGSLTVISYAGVKNKNSSWICKCECGNEVLRCRTALNNNSLKSCGWNCDFAYSLVGKKFGKLTVINREGMKNNTSYWKCLCECGTEIVVKRSHFGKNHIRSCGCRRRGQESDNWTGCGDISGSFFGKIKHHAKRRNIDFDISIDYLWDLFKKQNGKCVLSGIDLVFYKHSLANCTASLDRINSSIGYIEGNVQWVHKDVNFMKQQFSQDYFIEMCNFITKNNS